MKGLKGIVLPAGVVVLVSFFNPAHAIPILVGADRVLGIVSPSEPANPNNEQIMVNGLLEGWGSVFGYNDGAASGTVLGDNPTDSQDEIYTLKFTNPTQIPAPPNAPLVRDNDWYKVETSNPIIDLGGFRYDWVLAKWGKNAEVYYIGDLTGVIELSRVNLSKGGLSHYTLFNRTAVPDAGSTVTLLGLGLLGLGWWARRRG
jgi:hypothetical protein